MLDCRKSSGRQSSNQRHVPDSDLREEGRATQDQPCLTQGPVTTGAGVLPGQWSIEQETLIPVFLYYYLFMAVETDGDQMWEATGADTWDSLGLHPTHFPSSLPEGSKLSASDPSLGQDRMELHPQVREPPPRHGVTQRKPSTLCCALDLGAHV